METDSDFDFIQAMHDFLGIKKADSEKIIDRLSPDHLSDLTDALAKQDELAARKIVGRTDTDENINDLFRSKHLDPRKIAKKRRVSNSDGKQQFAIGDDVEIHWRTRTGETKRITATVSNPDGPEDTDTLIVRVKGKQRVVNKKDVIKLEEDVIDITNVPALGRIQKLAGISVLSALPIEPDISPLSCVGSDISDPIGDAMAALDTLEAILPKILMRDAKAVRDRVAAIQALLSEHAMGGSAGRPRKL